MANPSDGPGLEGDVFVTLQVQGCGSCKRVLSSTEFCPSHRGRKGFWCHSCTRQKTPRKDYPPKGCAVCGEDFVPKNSNQAYCSKKCKTAVANGKKSAKLAASKPERFCSNPDCDADITLRRADTMFCSDNCRNKTIPAETRRKWRLGQKYGITPEDYDRMVSEQGDKCYLCDATEPGTKHGFWHIDHCHTTGVVRKLLCGTCNTGLGSFFDNPETLRRAADYIEAHAII